MRLNIRDLLLPGVRRGLPAPSLAQSSWPAEPWSAATNLTNVEGAGTNDFHQDLSGAFWNPVTCRLWLCRNGPSDSTSKLWALREDGLSSLIVDTRAGNRGEWTSFGDFEAVTQADLSQDVIYAMVETEEVIKSYLVASYGTQVLLHTWNACRSCRSPAARCRRDHVRPRRPPARGRLRRSVGLADIEHTRHGRADARRPPERRACVRLRSRPREQRVFIRRQLSDGRHGNRGASSIAPPVCSMPGTATATTLR